MPKATALAWPWSPDWCDIWKTCRTSYQSRQVSGKIGLQRYSTPPPPLHLTKQRRCFPEQEALSGSMDRPEKKPSIQCRKMNWKWNYVGLKDIQMDRTKGKITKWATLQQEVSEAWSFTGQSTVPKHVPHLHQWRPPTNSPKPKKGCVDGPVMAQLVITAN